MRLTLLYVDPSDGQPKVVCIDHTSPANLMPMSVEPSGGSRMA